MEVLMRKLILGSFALISLSLFITSAVSAQVTGTRVEANIPFDFTVGDENFAAGSYRLLFTKGNGSVYHVSLMTDKGRPIMKTMAVQNGSTLRNKSELVFAVTDGGYFLEKLRTPDAGYLFSWSAKDKKVAQVKRVGVPTESSPN